MCKQGWKFRFLQLAVWLSCAYTYCSATGAQQADALKAEDTVNIREFGRYSGIGFSSDGKWLTYVVRGTGREIADVETYYRTGVPPWDTGTDIFAVNELTGETRNLTGGKGSNWLPRWSPDGHYIAFLSDRDDSGQTKLWFWDAVKKELRKRSDLPVRAQQIEWAPDSKGVFITTVPQGLPFEEYMKKVLPNAIGQSSRDGIVPRSTVQLYRPTSNTGRTVPVSDPWNINVDFRDLQFIEVADGESRTIVGGRRVCWFAISPDGSQIAFTSDKRFEEAGSQQVLFDLISVSLSTQREKAVASDVKLDYDGKAFSWSPGSSYLAFHTGGVAEKTYDCYVVNSKGGSPRNVTGLPNHSAKYKQVTPLWSESGERFYFIDKGTLWKASLRENTASEVAEIPHHQIKEMISVADNVLWTTDGGTATIVLAHDDEGKQDGFFKIDLTAGKSTKALEKGQCYLCEAQNSYTAVSRDGRLLAYFAEDAEHDTDLWLSDSSFNSSHRVTRLNPQFDKYKMGIPRLIEWIDDDGLRLQGVLLLPSDYHEGKRYPLVVWIYGGGALSDKFSTFGLVSKGPFNMQLFATRGFAVLLPDSRVHIGSPMVDLAKTVLPGVSRAIELGVADPERVGILGQSFGGYCVLALTAQTKLFRAAIEADGTADLVGYYGQMQRDGSAYATANLENGQGGLGGPPWQLPQEYVENSPIFHFDRIETPLLIVHGSADSVIAPFLGDEIFVGLRRLGKVVEYAKYEGEDHSPLSWTRANQIDLDNRMIDWFDKYLKY